MIRRGDGRVAPAYFGARYSTKDMLRVERELVAAAARRRCEGAGVARSGAVEAALARRPSMRDEQAEMVRSVCRSGAGVQVVRGRAGTGKTYALAAAREAWEQSGVPVGGVALSASSARLLESETGIASRTVAQLKAEIERWGGLDGAMAGGVLVVDEAAMVGTRGLKLLIDAAGELGVAVRLVGDDAQLPEIDAGGALRALAEREGAVELRRVRRQSDRQLRLALEDLRVGEGERYLAGAVERGAVTIAQTPEAQRAAAVERWWADAQEHGHERSVLLAARHSHRRELNELARERMRTAGLLGERELQVGGLAFSVGDRVVALRNRRSVGLLNGDRGTVGALDEDGLRIGLDDGRQVRVGLDYLQGRHLDLGYAMTVHKAQGQTFERAHFLGDEGVYRELAYTAATRGRQETRFYFVAPDPGRSRPGRGADEDGLAALARGLSESRAKELALEAQARAQAGPEGPNGDRDWERFRAAPARGPEGRPEDPRRTPPPDPPHVAARRAERDRLAAVVDTFPSVAAGALQAHQEEIDKRGRWAEQEQAKAQRCREELARLGPLARRGERGRELRDRIAGHEQVVANLRRGQHTAQAEIERIQRGPDSPARWEAEHPDARERLQAAERAFDAAVEREAARAIEHPAEHLTRVLGEPPARQDATRREVWLQAAQAVERYRITHQIDPAEPTALGPTPEPGRGSWDRPYDWRRAGERLLEAREQLGIAHSGSGSLEERLARVEGLMPERDRQRTVERDLGRGI